MPSALCTERSGLDPGFLPTRLRVKRPNPSSERGPLIRLIFAVADPPIPTIPNAGAVRNRTVPARPRHSHGLVLSTLKNPMRTEVPTFAFSVAAHSLISFFPFVVLLMTLVRRVFHSRA